MPDNDQDTNSPNNRLGAKRAGGRSQALTREPDEAILAGACKYGRELWDGHGSECIAIAVACPSCRVDIR